MPHWMFEKAVLAHLTQLNTTGVNLVSIITDLQAAVGADADRIALEVAEILVVLNDVRQQLADAIAAGADPATLQAIHDKLQASIATLDVETPTP